MLGQRDAIATIAVKDLSAAEEFYGETLGLTRLGDDDDMIVFKSGNTLVNVYTSHYAGTNEATSLTWNVGEDLERVMEELRARGAKFERYDLPGVERQGDVHLCKGTRVAWFKDPDGNILSLVSA